MKQCIVPHCENTSDQGLFVGDLCSPCHQFITTWVPDYSQAYRNHLKLDEHRNRMKLAKKFMVFESIDGAGKTTLSKRLAEQLDWFWTKEPTFTSEQADSLNLNSKDETGREVEFAIDRIKHISEISKLNKNIICDRYIWSGLVYCLKYNQKAFDFIKNFYLHDFFPKPDYYVFVDTPPEICLERAKNRSENFSLSLDDLNDLRRLYLETEKIMSKQSKIITIKNIGRVEDIVNSIVALM